MATAVTTRRATPRRQRGAVSVMAGTGTVVLILMLGLVLDLGHLYVVKTELQNAADACALAAVWEMTPYNDTARDRTIAAGKAVGKLNRVDFQSTEIADADWEITFSEQPDSGFGSDFTPVTRYVRCSPHGAAGKSVVMWFMGVWGMFSSGQATYASAVSAAATAGIRICGFPLAFCTRSASPTEANLFGFTVGGWYDGRLDNPLRGAVGWIEFDRPGAKPLKEQIAGSGDCTVAETGQEVLPPSSGTKQGLEAPWNTRFALYKGAYDVDTSPPDWTGFGYTWSIDPLPAHGSWPPPAAGCADPNSISCDALGDFRDKQQGHVAFSSTDPGWKQYRNELANGFPASAELDRRLVIMPVVRCDDLTLPQAPVLGWGCGLLLAPIQTSGEEVAEFLGTVRNSPCVGRGVPGNVRIQLVR